MILALNGPPGTGKTTLGRALVEQLPGAWRMAPDYFRVLAHYLGYGNPGDIVRTVNQSVSFPALLSLASAALGQLLSFCDEHSDESLILDGGASNYMVYLDYLKGKVVSGGGNCSFPLFIEQLHGYCCDKEALTFYLPTGVFPMVADDMRVVDEDFQKELFLLLKSRFDSGISPHSLLLRAGSLEDRVSEIKRRLLK